jgi:hypothetical protein
MSGRARHGRSVLATLPLDPQAIIPIMSNKTGAINSTTRRNMWSPERFKK